MKRHCHPPLPWKFHSGGGKSPEQLVQVHLRGLSREQLSAYLKRLLTRENQCRPRKGRKAITPPWHEHLHPRLRRKRLVVANALHRLGHPVSARLLRWALPDWRHWPGTLYLVGSYVDEDLRSKQHDAHPITGADLLQQAAAHGSNST
jgi:hypothetical protein